MEFTIANDRKASALQLALTDIYAGLFGSFIWFHLAWQDIKQRYRRSVLGPFWLTISTGVFLGAMGPLYAKILNQPVGIYFQHLAVSLTVWLLISSFVSESCSAFISAERFIKEVRLPFSLHLARALARSLIIFGHNLVVVVIVLIFYPPERIFIMILVPFGLLLIVANLFWVGLILAILCARFRDVPQIVNSVMTIAFFVTPVLWRADTLGTNRAFVLCNPLFHLVDVVRAPMLGTFPSYVSWWMLSILVLVECTVALALFSRFRARISYWV